jgi:hypothetical protein
LRRLRARVAGTNRLGRRRRSRWEEGEACTAEDSEPWRPSQPLSHATASVASDVDAVPGSSASRRGPWPSLRWDVRCLSGHDRCLVYWQGRGAWGASARVPGHAPARAGGRREGGLRTGAQRQVGRGRPGRHRGDTSDGEAWGLLDSVCGCAPRDCVTGPRGPEAGSVVVRARLVSLVIAVPPRRAAFLWVRACRERPTACARTRLSHVRRTGSCFFFCSVFVGVRFIF